MHLSRQSREKQDPTAGGAGENCHQKSWTQGLLGVGRCHLWTRVATGPLSWVIGNRTGNSDCSVNVTVQCLLSPELTNVFYGKVKVWLQRELKANRLNLSSLSIGHVDHVIRKVFRCEKRKESGSQWGWRKGLQTKACG